MSIKSQYEKIQHDLKMIEVLRQEHLSKLSALQKRCDHQNVIKDWYSWRIGCKNEYYFCEDCGKMLDPVDPVLSGILTTTNSGDGFMTINFQDNKS